MRETHGGGKNAVAGSPHEVQMPPNRKVGGLPEANITKKPLPRRRRRGG